MQARTSFAIEKSPTALIALLPQIQALADSEKDALGFLPEGAIRGAILRGRLFALTVGSGSNRQMAGYLLYSGVYPHAKIQQIATLPEYRKSGAASAMINCLVSDLERLGFLTIRADIASDLRASLAFYAKNGFEKALVRPGGKTRKRTIIAHVKNLETDSLFSAKPTTTDFDRAIQRRAIGDVPLFAFDLNIYFDLVRERENSEKARLLFAAALAHQIRLVVADEFVSELRSTSKKDDADPILQMALQIPRLPKIEKDQLEALTKQIHGIAFEVPNSSSAGSKQALSDSRHLAHATLARASAFITRDGALISARSELLTSVGVDVVALDELVSLLPSDHYSETSSGFQGNGFELLSLSRNDIAQYLTEVEASQSLVSEFTSNDDNCQVQFTAIRENEHILAVGAIKIPKGMEPVARLLLHVRPEHLERDMFADCLIDQMTRFACAALATTIELIHVPGQSIVYGIAKVRGFIRSGATGNYLKVALGKPLTPTNWSTVVPEIRRRTGLQLPGQLPTKSSGDTEIQIQSRAGEKLTVSLSRLEDLLSPAVMVWEGREGVIAPITRAYADDLLGTSQQSRFTFISNPDASFLSRRAYVNSPRTAKVMRPDSPILFYESKRQGNGRGAVVALGRIVNSVVVRKHEMPKDGRQRIVVEEVDAFSATDDLLLTTFDNLLVLPKPVPFAELKRINAVGRANLVTAVSISSQTVTHIVSQGWSNV